MGKMLGKSWQESRLLWHIAFPAILTAVFQFSIGFVTVGFVGHIGEVELAAVTVVENVVEGFAYGVLVRTPQANQLAYMLTLAALRPGQGLGKKRLISSFRQPPPPYHSE